MSISISISVGVDFLTVSAVSLTSINTARFFTISLSVTVVPGRRSMTMVGGPLPAVMTTGATVVVVVATGPTEETA